MGKFRKKPVVIEAFQVPLIGPIGAEAPGWWQPSETRLLKQGDQMIATICEPGEVIEGLESGALIGTLEGTHYAAPGDWIIQGVKGELYPCKPDIFAMTYEAA